MAVLALVSKYSMNVREVDLGNLPFPTGVEEKIKWERTTEGLVVNYLTTKPDDHAILLKLFLMEI